MRAVAILFPLFFLFVAMYPVADHVAHGVFIWFVWVLTLGFFPFRGDVADRKKIPFYDWIMMVAVTLVCGYYVLDYERLINSLGFVEPKDRVIIIIALALSLETARRVLGWVLPIIAACSLIYTYYSGFLPDQIMTRLFLGDLGIFGTITDVFARYVLLFFIFGKLMERAGATDFFRLVVQSLSGGVKGGPAKAAVVGSAAMGTIMGASAGNVAVTGTLTIPMMKKYGYKPHVAAAIECAASLGGEITPPVMGAAVFLLVANTGVPYRELILISALPAVLYYLSIFITIHLQSDRDRIIPEKASGKDESPWSYLRQYAHLGLPPALLVFLIIYGYSPTYGAAGGIVAALIVSQLRAGTRISFPTVVDAFVDGSVGFVKVGATAAVLGLILMGVVMGGLPVQFGSWAMGLTGGHLPMVILAIFFLGLVLGMGMPIVGAYLILATVAGPALESFGIATVPAHLLILWFVESAAITPPVALATFVASGIAGSRIYQTSLTAMRMAIPIYIIPIMMIYTRLVTGSWFERFTVFGWACLGFFTLAMANTGFLKKHLNAGTRILALGAAIGLFYPDIYVRILSAVVSVALIVWSRKGRPGDRPGHYALENSD